MNAYPSRCSTCGRAVTVESPEDAYDKTCVRCKRIRLALALLDAFEAGVDETEQMVLRAGNARGPR